MAFRCWIGRSVLVMIAICMKTELASAGLLFFSTDTSTDELVQIDATTGNVAVVGSLGFDARDLDLARVGNRLFALNSESLVRVDLHEINLMTGASFSSFQVHTASGNVINAEGLAQINGQLKIGYQPADAANGFSSALGDLALNGLITNTQTASTNLDFDALGEDPVSGTLYGVDREPSNNTVDFYTVNQSPLTISVFKTISSSFGPHDIIVSGNTLYAIDNLNTQLHSIDLTTSSFSSVNLNRSGSYLGIANATAIPEPSSFALLGIGSLGLFGYGWRRKRSVT